MSEHDDYCHDPVNCCPPDAKAGAGPFSVAETLKIPLEGLPAEWKRLENYYQQLSDAAHPGYDQGSFQGKAIGYGNCAAILKDRLAAETPTWFQDLNQKLKLFAQEHGIPFPYNETLEGRVMTMLEQVAARAYARKDK